MNKIKRIQKKQILDILLIIKEAQENKLYGDCQEGAFSLCDFIDEAAGEGTQTVVLLEQYCELLFKVNNGELSETSLSSHMKKIENVAKQELKTRIEIAFLSYKASMSDSLETIYFAAKADPDCDAYWIPIPYYEYKSRKELLEKLYYEGPGFYSDKFEIIDWQKYNLEERRPDAIFTFNPYDKTNTVTQVHPDFHCERLRDLTDMLVYVPYFNIFENIFIEKFWDMMVITNGCLYAHKVFVQFDEVRKAFINYYKKAYEDKYGDKFGKPEDKFLTLGSPKFDKVIYAKPEEYPLLKEWEKIIGKKKIFLFATSIGDLSQGTERCLRDIEKVLDFLKKSEEVVLWWRPHPLTNSVFNSMYPDLLIKYGKIVEEYRNKGYGIFDNTPDLHRALVWSDVFYGHARSLFALFDATKKPMGFSSSILKLHGLLCVDGDIIWRLDCNGQALSKMTLGKSELVAWLPVNSLHRDGFYGFWSSFALINKKLISVYIYDKTVYCYDIKNSETLEINLRLQPEKELIQFFRVFAYKEYAFLIGLQPPVIARINMLTMEVDYYTEWALKTFELYDEPLKSIVLETIMADNNLILSIQKLNLIIFFDVETYKYKFATVKKYDLSWLALGYDGNDLWLSAREKLFIARLDLKTSKVKEFINFPKEVQSEGAKEVFGHIVFFKERMWFFPYMGDAIISIGVLKNDIKVEKVMSDNGYSFKNYYSSVVVYKDAILASRAFDGKIEIFGKEQDIAKEPVSEQLENEYVERRLNCLVDFSKNKKYIFDSSLVALENLAEGTSAGQKIFDFVKKELSNDKYYS